MRVLGLKLDVSEKSGLVSLEIETEHDVTIFQMSAEAARMVAEDIQDAAGQCDLFAEERRAERKDLQAPSPAHESGEKK